MTSANTDSSRPESRFRRITFPPERRLVLDTLHLGHNKPMMHGLLELDVTAARCLLREQRRSTGAALSFTAFVLASLGRAVAAHPEVHALQDWFGRVVIFEEVDATIIVEVDVAGRPFALAHVMKGINHRSVRELTDEIESVKRGGIQFLPPGLLAGTRMFLRLPGFLRRVLHGLLLRAPHVAKRHTGTLLVTSVGMFGAGMGWGFSAPGIHNLSIVVGGIGSRASVREDETGPREILCLTVSANHELVDGAPLARFIHRLTREIERGEVLLETTRQER